MVRKSLKQYKEAMDDFNIALSLNKNNVNALIGRGNLRKLLTQMSEALKDFNEAIKLNP